MEFLTITPLDGVSAATSTNSNPIQVGKYDRFSILTTVAGATTPEVALKVQVSNDKVDEPGRVANWVDLASASVSFTDNGTDDIVSTALVYRWMRLVYTRTSGTGGTVTARLHLAGPR